MYIPSPDDYSNHKGIPALPFSALATTVRKPLGNSYIDNPTTIGELLRNRRLELHLRQNDVAELFKVSEDCITYWENNRFEPQIRHASKVINFLGYDPYKINIETFGGKIKQYRVTHGLSHKEMGKFLGVNASTVGSWERNKNSPQNKTLRKLLQLFADRSIQ